MKVLYLDDDRVRTWFKRYQAGGLDEMKVFDWKGRSGNLSRERMAELSARPGERCPPMHLISTPSRGYGLSCTAK